MNGVRILRLIGYTLLLCAGMLRAQGVRYRDTLFASQLSANYQFGQAVNVLGSTQNLYLDIYQPAGDTLRARPLVIYCHGGGFKDAARISNVQTRFCTGLAKRGYVVANIDYRTGSSANLVTDEDYYKAMYRAVQDAKAAVRFMRKNAAAFKVDTSRIYAAGNSAGGKVVLHMAYLQQNEVPSFLDTAVMGSIEGSSGTPGYSSRIHGIINLWGAMWDYKLMRRGDIPVFNVHGTSDSTVPYDSSFSYHGFKYGSQIIYNWAQTQGVVSGLRLFYNTGHTLDNSAAKQDSALNAFSLWLYGIVSQPSGAGKDGGALLPVTPRLLQNYPNPFNPATRIQYVLPAASRVQLAVFNQIGQQVAELVNGYQEAGEYAIPFSPRASSSGVYFCSLSANGTRLTKKMMFVQ